jgi:ABC-type antimicrobial peptide transport system permease subunit
MSETSFSINDLLRRRLQTSLVVVSLALSVASTIFLLLFAEKIGFGISLMVEDKLTAGFSAVFSPYILLLVILILVAGAVMVSFMVSMMMSQRIRDIGLMKATGCPNDLAFGYFFTELLIVSVLGCLLGVFLGFVADFASTNLFGSLSLRVSQVPFDMWLVLIVFVVFMALALIVGAKPIFDASRIEPAKAMSPMYYLGLSKESSSKALSGSRLTWRIALRSLIRHKSATIKIVVCLSIVFTIVTVGVAGGLIADQTTKSWAEKAIGKDTVLIAHQDVCNQYRLLLKEFVEGSVDLQFNYTNETYAVSDSLLNQLSSLSGQKGVDARLVLKTSAREVQGIILGNSTSDTRTVGDSRKMETLIVGVEPDRVVSNWFLRGRFLGTDQALEIVVGDTLSKEMFSEPLIEGVKAFDGTFDVVGVCLDPINNGKVAYVPLKTLENVAGVSRPNVVLLTIDPSANRKEFLDHVEAIVNAQNPEFSILELNDLLDESLNFLGYIWSSVMLLPLFSLVAASLCLIGYVILTINEQRQEFGILRAIGATPGTVVHIISEQSMLVLLSSYGVGTGFGIIITLLILVQEPFVTSFTVLSIAGWLIVALAATFIASLYPAMKFAKKPLLEVMKQV